LVWCRMCQDYLTADEFETSKHTDWGYKIQCKKCSHKNGPQYDVQAFKKQEKELCNEMLEKMGYKPNDEFTIHEQFLIKHQDKITQRKYEPPKRGKYQHLNPPAYSTKEYHNWYNKEIRRKKD